MLSFKKTPLRPLFLAIYTPKSHYVDVKMKWKKDPFYDSIQPIQKSNHLKSIISIKNDIQTHPNSCIPISAISKLKFQFDAPTKVCKFIRQYPSFFEEFRGEPNNLPWFRLTHEAIDLDREEWAVYRDRRPELAARLRRLILMSKEKKLPLSVIRGMGWYLGLPNDFIQNPDGDFEFVEMGDGVQGLRAVNSGEDVISVVQRNAVARMGCLAGPNSPIAFPLFPSKGLRLKRKIEVWLDEFQKLPYVSPYEDSSHLRADTDVSEKRAVGILHELLSLFVDHAAERRKLICLRKHLRLPQKFSEVFVRHPHIFYLSLKNKTCTVILKEAYSKDSAIEKHPILEVRKKYIELMDKSKTILRDRRSRKPAAEIEDLDSDGEMDSEGVEDFHRINL
ncbi:protein WHAT'S THIS FACTOR 9, mitochondrial [Magnolia sinica]|uniref:protein WHAT'S THIS FACTOR 9, mitochondrial n=1 Tax=Magnolia sinica TaxID=86752 RepID=UPI00265B0AF9|nr:protein WHAT'S THIS FACTOR 9, mitochondrial [Magnolia sinica]